MGYKDALLKAWRELERVAQEKNYSVKFLADTYTVELKEKRVISLSCNVPAKDYTAILILHYLLKKLKGLPSVKGEWISFRELSGGAGYYPVFKKRVIGTIMRKFKADPRALLESLERLCGKKTQVADVSVALEVFDQVPILITFWKGDDEFGPEANVLYDKNITNIFCTEDIVVISEIVAHSV